MAADSGIVSGRFPCTFGTERLHCTLSGIMEEHKENTSQPRIPSDIRTYFFLLALAAITFVILWLVFRFI